MVVALTLMIVARRMKAANILPKGLTTVETLGCVNVICSDKTGTLTENRMSVTTCAFADHQFERLQDVFDAMATEEPPANLLELYRAAVLCNDATFDPVSLHLPVNQRGIQAMRQTVLFCGLRNLFKLLIPFVLKIKELMRLRSIPRTSGCSLCSKMATQGKRNTRFSSKELRMFFFRLVLPTGLARQI